MVNLRKSFAKKRRKIDFVSEKDFLTHAKFARGCDPQEDLRTSLWAVCENYCAARSAQKVTSNRVPRSAVLSKLTRHP